MTSHLIYLRPVLPAVVAENDKQVREFRYRIPRCMKKNPTTGADPIDELAGLGRWSKVRGTSCMRLSSVALHLLCVEAGSAGDMWTTKVASEDAATLGAALATIDKLGSQVVCDFRVIDHIRGVRWLRLQSLPAEQQRVVIGMLTDVTATKLAARRERFNLALTQYLVSTDTFDDAVYKIIRLVCAELGWEWGAYWATESGDESNTLNCRQVWHAPDRDYSGFRDMATLAMYPDKGSAGGGWLAGQAQWVDANTEHTHMPRARAALRCGLQSGFYFPVTYIDVDGSMFCAGVLEFFSAMPRQREAQLPGLAESIGALIAQTAQRMVQQQRVKVLAQTDELTALINRAHFYGLLDAACGKGAEFALLYIDLDRFKPINDGFGHAAGNLVLRQFADRLRGLAPSDALVARLGGDEFALMTSIAGGKAELDVLSNAVLAAAGTHFNYRGHELSVSASVGVSLFPLHARDGEQLLHAADAAMYVAKRRGRNQVSYFNNECDMQQHEVAAQLLMLSAIQDALDRDEFFLEYQPICDTQGGQLIGLEALIRWRRDDGSVVPPDQFIPIAEQHGFIVQIGRKVIKQVCQDLPRLCAAGMDSIQVHVNMAAPEFLESELPRDLVAITAASNIDPRHICLELTEGVIMQSIDKTLQVMRELVRLGFNISLDDFGMKYSSLSLLKELPISSLKIDRFFLRGVPHNRNDCSIVRSIIDLGRNMKLRVIAEGVEHDEQLSFLRQFGCPLIQGYLLGRPMPFARLLSLHGIFPSTPEDDQADVLAAPPAPSLPCIPDMA